VADRMNWFRGEHYEGLRPARSQAEVERTIQGRLLLLLNFLIALRVFELI
jgi:hypothetical protein